MSSLLGYKNGALFSPNESDVMLVGYPKSGNTWLNFLLASLISPAVEDVDFLSIEDIVSDIYFNDGLSLRSRLRPRLFKSHEPYNQHYKKVIYIVRDPRSVAVSYYYHHIKLKIFDESYSLDSFVKDFIFGKLDSFGTWGNHVDGWLPRLGQSNMKLVKYEDLKSTPMDILSDLTDLLSMTFGEKKDASMIQQSINWCSADNMRHLEEKCFSKHSSFKETRRDISFVRSGQTRVSLSLSSKSLIESEWERPMKELGYL